MDQTASTFIQYQDPVLQFCEDNSHQKLLPTHPDEKIYPVTLDTPPPYAVDQRFHRHSRSLCLAIQEITATKPMFEEKNLKRGELVTAIMSKPGWRFVLRHKVFGGAGWVSATHLEIYNPDADTTWCAGT